MVAIVMDNGAGSCKIGLSNEERPRSTFSSVIGRVRHQGAMADRVHREAYVGDEAQALRGLLALRKPLAGGEVTNWDDMEFLFENAFRNALGFSVDSWPDDKPILFTEPPLNPKYYKEKMTQIMFETFGVPALHVSLRGLHSMYDAGLLTGMSIDCGEAVTSSLPIYEGCVMPHSIRRTSIAGGRLTSALERVLIERGYISDSSSWTEIVREIKEAIAYVAADYERELNESIISCDGETPYRLPDGQTITVGDERFKCMEPLFAPELIGSEALGVHTMAYSSLMSCDVDARKPVANNIVLVGGTAAAPGFDRRFVRELSMLLPAGVEFCIRKSSDRKLAEWNGGTVLANLSTFDSICTSKRTYDEYGPSVAHRGWIYF